MSGIYPGAVLTADVEERPEVCIVGSGAGGSVLAKGLCEKGLKVVMLEEGGYHTRPEFDMQEATAYPMLYQEQGLRATDDAAITILQGRAVGGGTVVNWTTSFRTPRPVLEHWASAFGVEGLDEAALAPHWEAVEQRLNIHEQPADEVNANNAVLWRGAQKLGWQAQRIRRNVSGCINSGYCGMGCPVDGKMSMILTYLPDAVKAGLTVYADARADRIEVSGKRAVAIHASVLDPKADRPGPRKIVIRPKVLVLSCGAINSPALLLRSRLNDNGRVGRRTFLHPVVATAAEFDERIEGFYGAPQSVSSHQFIDRGPDQMGFFLESAPIHPMLAATAYGGFGLPHEALMARLAHTNVVIGLVKDGFAPGDEGGAIGLKHDGRPKVHYPISTQMQETFREISKVMARIQLAAGAKTVRTLSGVEMRGPDEIGKLDAASFAALHTPVFSAHQMGGCAMGKDPAVSVVNSQLRHHQLENLFVVDGSVFPTSLGVNPQESIYGIAGYATQFVGEAAG